MGQAEPRGEERAGGDRSGRYQARKATGISAFTAKTWCASARVGSARACMRRRWVGSCILRELRLPRQKAKTQPPAKKARPRRRPLKRAPALLRKIQRTHEGA